MKAKTYEELKEKAMKRYEEIGFVFPQNKGAFSKGFIDGYMAGYDDALDTVKKILSPRTSIPDAETR